MAQEFFDKALGDAHLYRTVTYLQQFDLEKKFNVYLLRLNEKCLENLAT
jgi:hypothetical protein